MLASGGDNKKKRWKLMHIKNSLFYGIRSIHCQLPIRLERYMYDAKLLAAQNIDFDGLDLNGILLLFSTS